jgi:uncharacterized membrane protein YbaN (DUF454 family)
MRSRLNHVALLIAGWGFILLGIAGLFLPFLQGVLFILIGLTILSTQYAWAHRWMTRLHQRFPKLSAAADRLWARIARRWPRLSRQRGPH